MEVLNESIYDHPRWYDLVFGSDCAAETRFIEGCTKRFFSGRAKRMFEPACGTGRLLLRLAQKGYQIGGLDLNPHAVEFCNERLKRLGQKSAAWVADMSAFEVKKPFDIAFNTINSFRHLSTEQAALAHLKCMGEAVVEGGLYLLGFHLTPTVGIAEDQESWVIRRGHLCIQTRMWPIEKQPKKRMERFGIQFDIHTPSRTFRINDELRLRSYTAAQAKKLIQNAGCWEIAETYDFHYDLRKPVVVNASSEDVVFVLRRTG
jgi:SAM-dependent methyltransferase